MTNVTTFDNKDILRESTFKEQHLNLKERKEQNLKKNLTVLFYELFGVPCSAEVSSTTTKTKYLFIKFFLMNQNKLIWICIF